MRSQVQAREASLPTGVGPATASAREVEKDVPVGNASLVHGGPNELQPPIDANAMAAVGSAQSLPNASCGLDPRTGLPYRFSPETGQPCSSAQDRVVVRQPSYTATQPTPAVPEPTPEERRIAAAYQRLRDFHLYATEPTGDIGSVISWQPSGALAEPEEPDHLALAFRRFWRTSESLSTSSASREQR